MTANQLLKLLTAERGAQTLWARRLGVDARAVRRWVDGSRGIPDQALRLAELWLRAEALVAGLQAAEDDDAKRPLDDVRVADAWQRLAGYLEADGAPSDRSAAAVG